MRANSQLLAALTLAGVLLFGGTQSVVAGSASAVNLSEIRLPGTPVKPSPAREPAGLSAGLSGYYIYERSKKESRTALFPSEVEEAQQVFLANIGDSLSVRFNFTGKLGALWSMRTKRHGSWFSDLYSEVDSPFSISERLSDQRPVLAVNFARPGGYITPANDAGLFSRYVAQVDSMNEQIDRLIMLEQMPDVVFVWIGHNDFNWKRILGDREPTEEFYQSRVKSIVTRYKTALERIVRFLEFKHTRSAIVVMSPLNHDGFLAARKEAGRLTDTENNRFPFLEASAEFYQSLQPDNQYALAELWRRTSAKLKEDMVQFSKDSPDHVLVHHSHTMATAEVTIDMLGVDAWHPNAYGQTRIAELMFPEVQEVVDWVLEEE